jgi:hypothetical protein
MKARHLRQRSPSGVHVDAGRQVIFRWLATGDLKQLTRSETISSRIGRNEGEQDDDASD